VAPDRAVSIRRGRDGSCDILDNGDGTSTVTYSLSVDLAIAMLGMFKRKAERRSWTPR
jgi:hypothetical protein